MSERTFEATISYVKRMNSSVNGNPKFRLHLDSGETFTTATDADVAYEIENPGNIGHRVAITVYGRNDRVIDVRPVYSVGERVQSHPSTDEWAQGDRYGVVTKVDGNTVTVQLDKSGRRRKFRADNIEPIRLYS